MSRNPNYCPHNVTEDDLDTMERYCVECGDVLEDLSDSAADLEWSVNEDRGRE